ncbi:WD repeat-containing protein 6 isoform X2 [Ischnura elegans]|uniref:WD repeat-containing protein 6 isoform X2 n=1 Tax=Ischnura elegans TaxID=197161 RepID=UPI001ED8B6B3|nr:WD repeat-containing protein 6 isoform X2 [Ischnura elegans]
MESWFSVLDAAAVKLAGQVVIAGIGRSVQVHSIQEKKLLRKREVLCRHKVRDISLNKENTVLVYGGKELTVFQFKSDGGDVDITDVRMWKANDWIVYSKWLECGEIATLSAHNVVNVWNSYGAEKLEVKCLEQSILYSGYLAGDRSDDLICFAGTVYGQIVVWSVNSKNPCEPREALFHLRGHKGAVFSIRYDPISSLICSTSDDRSVRWWHKSAPTFEETDVVQKSLCESWSVGHVRQVSVAYGHLSRVWRCFIGPSLTFTVGEDSQLCVWKNVAVEGGLTDVEFPLIARKQILRGGSIWDVDFHDDQVALGLEDGGVRLWPLNSLLSQASMSSYSPFGSDDPSRRVCLIGKRLKPIVLTKSGSVLITRECNNYISEWKHACEKRYLGLCLLESNLSKELVAITSSDGSLDILSDTEDSFSEKSGDLKYIASVKLNVDYILSLHWLADDLILTCRSKGQLQLWHLAEGDGSKALREVATWTLPHAKQCWTTAAAWIPYKEPPGLVICGNRSGDLLVYSKDNSNPIEIKRHLHGQMGVTSLLVFWTNHDRHWMPTYHETYVQKQSADGHLPDVEVYSTGRDGIVNTFVPWKGALKFKGTDKLGFEWAARFLVLNKNVLVFGFKGACAVIWGIRERCVLLEKNCGGGHRSWDIDLISHGEETTSLLLAMIKNGELVTVDWKVSSGTLGDSVLQDGLHSREINSVSCFTWPESHSRVVAIAITGSEDTTAKVSRVSYGGDESPFSVLSTLHGHLSSVRAVSILPLVSSLSQNVYCQTHSTDVAANTEESIFEFLIFTAGGRAQLKAWKLSFDQTESSSSTSHEQCRVEEKFSLMLDNKKQDTKNYENNLETRFMDIQSFYPREMNLEKSCGVCVAVVAACSDGLLRIFGYTESPDKADGKQPYLGLWSLGIPHPQASKRHCLFKVLLTRACGRTIVMTTDCIGYYHLWDVTAEVDSLSVNCDPLGKKSIHVEERKPIFPFFSKLSHQFSINAIDWKQLSGESKEDPPWVLIASGGEDGAISLDLLEVSEAVSGRCEGAVRASWKLERAAATQIAGVKFVGNNHLVTVSKCQEVVLWRWCYNGGNSSLHASRVHSCYSTIPDIEDIDVINAKDGVLVVVCGCGLEIVRIDADELMQQA